MKVQNPIFSKNLIFFVWVSMYLKCSIYIMLPKICVSKINKEHKAITNIRGNPQDMRFFRGCRSLSISINMVIIKIYKNCHDLTVLRDSGTYRLFSRLQKRVFRYSFSQETMCTKCQVSVTDINNYVFV